MNNEVNKMLINNFDYTLPDKKIAKFPLPVRDNSKLLVYNKGKITGDKTFHTIYTYFSNKDLLVFNNTKVIYARLFFKKSTGATIELLCLRPCFPEDYQLALQQTGNSSWECIVGNLKKWKNEELEKVLKVNGERIIFRANKIKLSSNTVIVNFSWNSSVLRFIDIIESAGQIPIPPYLKRESKDTDKKTYQTIYSKINGSVAAPTAGLHFTKDVLKKFELTNIKTVELTLHIGAGTFQPVKTSSIENHIMHSERFTISKELIKKLLAHKGKITAVGTTTARSLESMYWLGLKIKQEKNKTQRSYIVQQWEAYKSKEFSDRNEILENLLKYLDEHHLDEISADTEMMIIPGYKFRMTDKLITNFHQPKSTLLLLIAAFIGDDWKKVYDYALDNDFRFLSYGDSCLFIP